MSSRTHISIHKRSLGVVRYMHIHFYTHIYRKGVARLSTGAWLGVMARLVAHTRIHVCMPVFSSLVENRPLVLSQNWL